MTRFARAICSLHAALFVLLAYCTVRQFQYGEAWAGWMFAAAAFVPLVSLAREAEHADEQQAQAIRAETEARRLAWADEDAVALARAEPLRRVLRHLVDVRRRRPRGHLPETRSPERGVNGPSSAPRGERAPTPGVTWDTELVRLGEVVVDIDRDENPFGWSEPETTPPIPNRATRRAAERAARRTK